MNSVLVFLAVVGGLASLVGIPLAYFLARRARQQPRLQYAVDFDVLVDPEGFASEGHLTFRGHSISSVSRTFVAIWNRRGDTIHGNDIVADDPIRLQVTEGDSVLQARVVYTSRRACALAVESGDGAVPITFDFLDQGDGGIIEVIHQGPEKPAVLGTIRGTAIDAGSLDTMLTPAAIDWMRYAGRRERFVRRFRAGREHLSRGRRRTAFVALVLPAVLLAVLLGVDAWRHWNPELIDTERYNLQTLQGQKDFADEVDRRGSGERLWTTVLFVLGILVGGAIVFVGALLGWRTIPRSIVAVEVTEEPGS